jgi:Cu2+-exporting ATPase
LRKIKAGVAHEADHNVELQEQAYVAQGILVIPAHSDPGPASTTNALSDGAQRKPAAAVPGSSADLRITGMFCAGCASAVEQALKAVAGVRSASASFATARAHVEWDAGQAALDDVLAAVRVAGYGAEEDLAAPARALRDAEQRRLLWQLFVAVFCAMQVMMYQAPMYFATPGSLASDTRTLLMRAAWLLSLPVVLFSCGPFFSSAWHGLRHWRVTMDLPVALGIVAAFLAGTVATFDPAGPLADASFDSLTMFVALLLGGRYLSLGMRTRAIQALEDSITRAPDAAHRLDESGVATTVPLAELRVGDRLRVLPGESFPADGPLLCGETETDEALLTGESLPVPKRTGDTALAGSLNLLGAVEQRVAALGEGTRHAGIVALVRRGLAERPAILGAADRLATPFLIAVLLVAAGSGTFWALTDPGRGVAVAVAVLIVTCPCAIALAAPAAFVAAAGALARRGILVQRLDAIETLARVDIACFDKTGTLTDRDQKLSEVILMPAGEAAGLDRSHALGLAGSLAALSSHPLSRTLAAAAVASGGGQGGRSWQHSLERAGLGIEAEGPAGTYRLGAPGWAGSGQDSNVGGRVVLGDSTGALAEFRFIETARAGAVAAVEALRSDGLQLVLLSGDSTERTRAFAAQLGIGQVRGDAQPADKLAEVALLQASGHRVAMVGDGLNDAPVLARADVSIALGDGAALARSRADIVLMSGSLADLAFARDLARRTMRIVHQNLAWAVLYNAICVPLAVAGLFPAWAAAAGMTGSSLVVIGNALRLDRKPGKPTRGLRQRTPPPTVFTH